MIRIVALAVGCAVVCGQVAAYAQGGRPARPYRGLFASGAADSTQSLLANASFGGGYDDNILLDLPGSPSTDPRVGKSGKLASLDGSVAYSVNHDRASFGSSIGSSVRYYPGQTDPYVTAHGANLGGGIRVGRYTSLSASQSITYQPFTFTSVFPVFQAPPILGELDDFGFGEPVIASLDQATSTAEYWRYTTTAGLSHRLSQRVTFNSAYNFQRSDTAYLGGAFTSQGGLGGVGVRMSKSLGVRLGYGLQQARYANNPDVVRTHTADVGLNFNKALAFSRRTTASFSSGTTAVSDGANTRYELVGSAALNHELGRTWGAFAAYNRSVQLLDIVLLPVIYDSLSGGVRGLVNRRVQVQSGVQASLGAIGVNKSDNFDTLQATAGVSFALTRFAELSTSYAFYRYRFDPTARLPVGVPHNIDRQSIRANVNLWAPIVNRARR